jgi:hypothetical protein
MRAAQVCAQMRRVKKTSAYLHHKEQRDIATVNGRIDTTDRRVDQVAQNAQEAHNAAS